MQVKNPQRWDVDDPNLYTPSYCSIPTADAVHRITRASTKTGFPSAFAPSSSRRDGFHLNGRRVQLHGVNLHHDHGPLGGAFYTRAMERQLEIMKDMGVNAIRTATTPRRRSCWSCATAWDCSCGTSASTNGTKRPTAWATALARGARRAAPAEHGDARPQSPVGVRLVDRQRDWAGGEGLTPERIAMMRDVVRKYDDTRPVGIASHLPDLGRGPMFDALDFIGWNYCRHYALYHEHYPDKPIIYSESASAVSTRGFYELPLPQSKTDYSRQRQVTRTTTTRPRGPTSPTASSS